MAAPYVIDVTLSEQACKDRDQRPKFFQGYFETDFFEKQWGKATGIFLRTHASLDEVSMHLRKLFYRQREDNKKWGFLRFWDPLIAPHYFQGIANWPERCRAWFYPRQGAVIESIIIEAKEGDQAMIFSPDKQALGNIIAMSSQVLVAREMDILVVWDQRSLMM